MRASKRQTKALGRLTRHPTCNPLRLEDAAGIPSRSTYNWTEGIAPISADSLALVIAAMVRLGQTEDAIGLLSEILGLDAVGLEVRIAARAVPAASVVRAALHAVSDTGAAQAEIAEALDDGAMSPREAEAVVEKVHHARHALDDLIATIKGMPSPQLALLGAAR